jgi:hypothetical protein
MTQRLVWNFEFVAAKKSAINDLTIQKEEELKWEARFFWPEAQIISMTLIDNSLLDLAHYQQKQKKDHYYLIPKHNYNIKSRRDELLYKPLVKENKYACGFATKININTEQDSSEEEYKIDRKQIMQELKSSHELLVKKDSFTYKFPTQPVIKLELARIEIDHTIYFSACIEGKSRTLVETLSKRLLGKQASCDYVRFLKQIAKIQ